MSYNPKYSITEKMRSSLQEIERLKNIAKGRRLLPEVEMSIRLRATVDTVHSSTSIEGNPLDAMEVRSIVISNPKLSKKEYAEIEVQNYKRALDYIAERRNGQAEISVDDVLMLHKIITERLLDKTRAGHFRQNEVYIENQEHEIIYEAAPVEEVREAVEELLLFVNANRAVLPAPIVAGILHYQMVTIHPFADGNGRVSRALALLYLAIMRYDCGGSLALDSYYAQDKQTYYRVLQRTHGDNYLGAFDTDLTDWLEYFAEGFVTALHVLDAEIRIVDLAVLPSFGQNDLSAEEIEILSYVGTNGSIDISDAEKLLPEMNRRTLQRRLKKLVDDGVLELVGSTHEAKYRLAK